MPTIEVHYFASLRERTLKRYETLEFEEKTYRDLYLKLRQCYHFDLPVEMIKVAVNDKYVSLDEEILSGARVVFIPPVAGG